jgi:hypothetical protein
MVSVLVENSSWAVDWSAHPGSDESHTKFCDHFDGIHHGGEGKVNLNPKSTAMHRLSPSSRSIRL